MTAAVKWLRRGLLVLAGIVLVAGLAIAAVLGTESGTRWVFTRIAELTPIEVSPADVNGTLLSRVEIAHIRLVDDARQIDIRRIAVDINWSSVSPSLIALDNLDVGEFVLASAPKPPSTEPLTLEMPALPVAIRAKRLRVDLVAIDALQLIDITAQDIEASGRTFRAAVAGLQMNDVALQLRDAAIEIDGNVPLSGELDWSLPGSDWAGSAVIGGSLAELDVRHELDGRYRVSTRGTVALLNRLEPGFDLDNEFAELAYEGWVGTDGRVRVTGTADNYQLEFATALSGDQLALANISGTAAGSLEALREINLFAQTDIADLRATGDVAWAPALSVDLTLVSNGIDPSQLAPVPPGSFDSELHLQATSVDAFVVEIITLSGLWNGQATRVNGRLSRQAENWNCGNCSATVGANRLDFNGAIQGRAINAAIDMHAPALQQLWPELSGSLTAEGDLRGTLGVPVLSGMATGSQIAFAGWSLGFLSVETAGATAEEIDVSVTLADLRIGELALGGGQGTVSGGLQKADVRIDWRRDDYAADIAFNLTQDSDTYAGTITSARLTEPLNGTWTLDGPTEFLAGKDVQRLAPASWSNGSIELRHQELLRQSDALSFAATLSAIPLELFNPFLPPNVQLEGSVQANLDLRFGDSVWNGSIDWRQESTVVQFIAGEGDRYEAVVPEAGAGVRIVDNVATLQAGIRTEKGTEARLDAELSELSRNAQVSGRLQLNGDRWAWVPQMFPRIDEFTGRIATDISFSGPLLKPDLEGQVNWLGGTLAVPEWNLSLEEITVGLLGTSAGDMTVTGEATSGEGKLRVSGNLEDVLSPRPAFKIELAGEHATILNWEDFLLVASPVLVFEGDTDGLSVTGDVAMDKAEIVVRELPEGAVSPSEDVTVAGREEEARRRTRVSGTVEIVLTDDIHVEAFGLDTNLEGQLRFTVAEDRPAQGFGELRLVGGVFSAYGQKLEIQTGTMVFTGPLDDPLINVRAVRKVETASGIVTAGVELSGRAQELSSTLFSDPAMSQADTLAYLVLGRPLEGATASEGNSLSNTAYSLGLKQAELITNQIGQTVGLDELRVTGNNQNTTELIAGKQINSRLYARYAYGVFRRVGKLLMRYKLSESFAIEIGAGEQQSMDILYTIEKE